MSYQTKGLTDELAASGFPLGNHSVGNRMSVEKKNIEYLIIKILNGNPDPRYVEGIPIIIYFNKLDYDKLLSLADNTLKQKLGYVLEITLSLFSEFNIKKDKDIIKKKISILEKEINGAQEIVFTPHFNIRPYIGFAKNRREDSLKKWKLIALYTYADFREQFVNYTQDV